MLLEMKKTALVGLALLSSSLLSTRADDTISEVVEDQGFTTLQTAIDILDLDVLLDCETSFWVWWCPEFTLFAPSNDAFDALGDVVTTLTTDSRYEHHLRDLVTYHVLPGERTASDIDDGDEYLTLNLESINATVAAGRVVINDAATVTNADLQASNGVVHAVDTVLLPMSASHNVVQRALEEEDVFSTLTNALDAAGLVDDLSGEGPFTVFAPTNRAFENFGDATLEALLDDPEGALQQILRYHVVPDLITLSDLQEGDLPTLLTDETLELDRAGWAWARYWTVNDATIVWADILCSNGVIHVIDTVLEPQNLQVPEPTVLQIIDSDSELTTLLGALEATGVSAALDGVTILAPTNDAFDDVDLSGLTNEQLIDILGYHVLAGSIESEDLESGVVQAANGDNLLVTVYHYLFGGVHISFNDEADVESADLVASNGVVHKIDKVLIPPGDVVEVASSSSSFETLVAAIQAAGLVADLQGAGPFTVFAPTDDAFADIGITPDTLPTDTTALRNLLLYHVVPNAIPFVDIEDAEAEVDTLLTGSTLTVEKRFFFFGLFFLDVEVNGNTYVEDFDILASNGIIHSIDSVLEIPA